MWILVDVHNWYAADFYAAGANAPFLFCNRLRDVITKIKSTSEQPVTRIQLALDSKESFRRRSMRRTNHIAAKSPTITGQF